ncbi:MAG: tetratricopeptide repeat protein [Steroidobacteraceae bacterium]
MKLLRTHRRSLIAGIFGFLLSLHAHARDEAAPKGAFTAPQVVRDLFYGDVLFHFYQDDYFGSLTRLGASQVLGRLTQQHDEAELLQGALYLSLGQHAEAGRIFRSLLNDNVADTVRNRAWFYLAKVWYQRSYLAEAEQALGSIKGALPEPLEGERQLLLAQVLMYQERYDEATRVLESLHSADESASYAKFNLGVALVRQDRLDAALPFLDGLGKSVAPNQEMAALRDKANVALGFALLQANRPAEARLILERVRLRGPQSNKALLGLGWAHSSEERYREALAPWLELQNRDLLDAAVQESYLAVPFAYARLSANRQAANTYVHALDLFREERVRLDQSIEAIKAGRLLDAILENDAAGQQGWYWQLAELPDAPETRYLYHLLASNEFQEGLKNYRDLKDMQRNLVAWRQSLAAFDDMIDTRRRSHVENQPKLRHVLGGVDLDKLESGRNEIESRLALVERDNDVVGLATPAEHEQWARIQHMETVLASADPGDPAVEEMREKVRLLRGVVYWDLSASYKARLWREKKQLRELDVALKDARKRQILVGRAESDAPQRTEELAARVDRLAPDLDSLSARLGAAAAAQGTYLASVAIAELEAQKGRLASYTTQAQFALASIYDRAIANPAVAQEGAAP